MKALSANIGKLCEARAKKDKMKALSFLMKDLSLLPERERIGVFKVKEEIAKEYNIEY